jgi:hypothetical protein
METVNELIEFLDKIPDDQWTGHVFEDDKKGVVKRCVAGHINHHLSGKATHQLGSKEPVALLCGKLGISRGLLVLANNNAYRDALPIKEAVLTHLRNLPQAI